MPPRENICQFWKMWHSQASFPIFGRHFRSQLSGVTIILQVKLLVFCPLLNNPNCESFRSYPLSTGRTNNCTRIWEAFESEIACFFAAWHLPTLHADYRAFFAASQEDKMVTPLGTLSVMLMICALGVMMRASQTEIFGEAVGVSSPQDAEADLTCSRLQSELYRE